MPKTLEIPGINKTVNFDSFHYLERVVLEYHDCGVEQEELFDVANDAFQQGLRSFDPNSDVPFLIYSAWLIKNRLYHYVANQRAIRSQNIFN